MSIKLMDMVFDLDPTRYRSTYKIVLIALADHANEDGLSIYPSVARLAHKCGLSERAVQRMLRIMEDDRVITKVENGGGRYTNEWQINKVTLANRCTTFTTKVNHSHPRGELQSPKPSYSHLKNHSSAGVSSASGDTTSSLPSPNIEASAGKEEDLPDEGVTYVDCEEDGSEVRPKWGARPKWSIPEDHPVLKRAMQIMGRKWWKDRGERALWKPVKTGIAAKLISMAWVENCLAYAEKRKISLGALLSWIANAEKMRDWEVRQVMQPAQTAEGTPIPPEGLRVSTITGKDGKVYEVWN